MRWNPGYSLVGLLILVLEIYCIVKVWQSGKPMIEKLLWTILILMFPLLGCIIWYFFGR